MSEPVPNRPERFTAQLGLRVPGDDEPADLVTVLGELLDTADELIARTARGQLATTFLHMGA